MKSTSSSLKARLMGIHSRMLLLVLAVVMPLLGVIALGAKLQIDRERVNVRERAQARARLSAAQIDKELGIIDTLLISLAQQVSLDPADVAKNERLFASIQKDLPSFYLKFRVYSHVGQPPKRENSGPDVTAQKFYREAIARRGFADGDPLLDEGTGKWTVTLARPVFDSAGSPAGVVSLSLDLALLRPLLVISDLPAGSLSTVVNRQGINIARSNQFDLIGQRSADREVIDAAIAAREGSVEFVTTRGSSRLAGYSTCSRVPWLVFVRVSRNEAFASVDHQLANVFLVVGAALLISFTLAWFLANHISHPIQQLAVEAAAFGESARPQPSIVKSGGEIGLLARAFDRMLVAVAQRDEALREEERRYRTLIELLPDAIAVYRLGKIIYVNPAAAAMLGAASVKELEGKDALDFVDPDFRSFARARMDEAADVGVDRQLAEIKFLKLDGTIIEAESQSIRITYDGQPAVQIIARDITQRKRAEAQLRESDQRFRELVDCTDAIVWEADPATFNFTSVSNNAERMLGYPIADWRQPGFWASHVHDEDRAQAVQYRESCARRLKEFEFEYRFVAQNGRVVWLRDDMKVIEQDGQPRWLRGLMVDITETRELEQQLRQSQKLEAIGTLASGIAHDFNNILAGIYGFTALARHSAGDRPELHRHLDEIARCARRAAELVRQILAFSRTRGNDEELAPLQFSPIMIEAVRLLRATSPSTVEFVMDLPKILPAVQGNATQLHQIVINLGSNAVQSMRDGHGRIELKLDACSVDEAMARTMPNLRPGIFVRLTVRDTGEGMDQATQDRAFEPFFTTKEPGKGTGLGLSVVHGIVRHHHGAIRLTSKLNEGTAVEVFLPATSDRPREEKVNSVERPSGHGERILLVDDEKIVALSGKLMLCGLGYAAESETQSLEALARIERDPQAFQLVISDQTMPNLTGLELARRVRAVRADLPVVLVSGHSAALTLENLRDAGVRELLLKPYSMDALAVVVHRQLGRAQLV